MNGDGMAGRRRADICARRRRFAPLPLLLPLFDGGLGVGARGCAALRMRRFASISACCPLRAATCAGALPSGRRPPDSCLLRTARVGEYHGGACPLNAGLTAAYAGHNGRTWKQRQGRREHGHGAVKRSDGGVALKAASQHDECGGMALSAAGSAAAPGTLTCQTTASCFAGAALAARWRRRHSPRLAC